MQYPNRHSRKKLQSMGFNTLSRPSFAEVYQSKRLSQMEERLVASRQWGDGRTFLLYSAGGHLLVWEPQYPSPVGLFVDVIAPTDYGKSMVINHYSLLPSTSIIQESSVLSDQSNATVRIGRFLVPTDTRELRRRRGARGQAAHR